MAWDAIRCGNRLALAMAGHWRLGRASPLAALQPDTLALIADLAASAPAAVAAGPAERDDGAAAWRGSFYAVADRCGCLVLLSFLAHGRENFIHFVMMIFRSAAAAAAPPPSSTRTAAARRRPPPPMTASPSPRARARGAGSSSGPACTGPVDSDTCLAAPARSRPSQYLPAGRRFSVLPRHRERTPPGPAGGPG